MRGRHVEPYGHVGAIASERLETTREVDDDLSATIGNMVNLRPKTLILKQNEKLVECR